MHNSKPTKIGEKGVADTFNYLERLFDVTKKPKNINEDQKKLIDECLDDHLKDYSDINNRIKAMRKYGFIFNSFLI